MRDYSAIISFLLSISLNFIKRLYKYRSIIVTMAVHEFRSRYLGTFVGFLWSVVNPLAMMLIYWFIFSVGFRAQPAGNMPYIVYFLSGFLPWSIFNDTVLSSTGSIRRYAHLITRSVFPTEVIVIVCLLSSFFTHIIMMVIFITIMLFNKISLSIYSLNFIVFLILLSLLAVGVGWMVSALNTYYKDVEQIVGILLNMWFWLTPIIWVPESIPAKFQQIVKINPMYHVVESYRAALIYHSMFSTRSIIYISIVALIMFVAGGFIFRRLKPDFAEVL